MNNINYLFTMKLSKNHFNTEHINHINRYRTYERKIFHLSNIHFQMAKLMLRKFSTKNYSLFIILKQNKIKMCNSLNLRYFKLTQNSDQYFKIRDDFTSF